MTALESLGLTVRSTMTWRLPAAGFGQDAGEKVHDHAWVLTWGLALACMSGLYGLLAREAASGQGEQDAEEAS